MDKKKVFKKLVCKKEFLGVGGRLPYFKMHYVQKTGAALLQLAYPRQ